jgi:hypothetical protein
MANAIIGKLKQMGQVLDIVFYDPAMRTVMERLVRVDYSYCNAGNGK